MRQLDQLLLYIHIQCLKLSKCGFGQRLSISKATFNILELLPNRKDEPDGLLSLLIQLLYLEEILILKLSEVVDRQIAVELPSLFPASADVFAALLVVEDQVGAFQDPALFAFEGEKGKLAVACWPLFEQQGVDSFVLYEFVVGRESQVAASTQAFQPNGVSEVQMSACFWFDGIYQPQSINRLECFFSLQFLKSDLLLVIGPQGGQEGIALNMAEPHGLPINISDFLLLPFVVHLQHDLGLIVQPDQRLLLADVLVCPQGQVPHFGAIEFRCKVKILIELDFIGNLGLVLKTGQDLKEGLLLGQFQLDSGIVGLILELRRVREVLVGDLVPEQYGLLKLYGCAELAGPTGIDFDIEEIIFKEALELVGAHDDLASCM